MIDAIVGIVALIAFYRGYTKGLVRALLSLIAVLIGSICSLKLAHLLAAYLNTANIIDSKFILPISFILIFVGTIYIFRLIINALEGVLKMAMLGWLNKLVGGLLYALIALFAVSGLFYLAQQVNMITPQGIATSKTYNYVSPIAPKAITILSDIMPYCKNLLNEVTTYFKH
jgi:membrane protein required for colicin V production